MVLAPLRSSQVNVVGEEEEEEEQRFRNRFT
jgi:hypothetical protein